MVVYITKNIKIYKDNKIVSKSPGQSNHIFYFGFFFFAAIIV